MLFRRTCTTFVCALAVVMATTGIARAQDTDYPIAPAPQTSIGGKIALASMFSTTAIVQALDFHSTFEALELGAVELNPAVKPFTKSKPAFAILKAGVAASTMYLGYSLAKKSKLKAFLAMALINSLHAYVVWSNYQAVRQMRALHGAR